MVSKRNWMYERIGDDGKITEIYADGVKSFLTFALGKKESMNGNLLRCPCSKCRNLKFFVTDTVHYHLLKDGFVNGYTQWTKHGEEYVLTYPPLYSNINRTDYEHDKSSHVHEGSSFANDQDDVVDRNNFSDMVMDLGSNVLHIENVDDTPNPNAKKFFDMLEECHVQLWPGCSQSKLETVAQLLNVKAESHISDKGFDGFVEVIKRILPVDHKMINNFYDTKKLLKELGLPVESIDCCMRGCMIYWGDDVDRENCKFCLQPRYMDNVGRRRKKVPFKRMYYFPLAPRLQRLYYSKYSAEHMRWHSEHVQDGDKMCHPSDSEAWKHFDKAWPDFAAESRNVRLGLCTDGFNPFGQSGAQYSLWPVMVTPYNLPPGMCMKEKFMFLTIIIPGPSNPKQRLDVYLQPLIAELKKLWSDGVETFDVSKKENFTMRAVLLWTISDFPGFSMLSGWTTAGKLACPYCMQKGGTIYLTKGSKTCWFDCHRKFLRSNHPFRKNVDEFRKGVQVVERKPTFKSGRQILDIINRHGLVKITELDAATRNGINGIDGWKKRSIFWDLPYWSSLLIRHNLDVMHIEKNCFDNVFSTVMGIEGKTKDNANAREDIEKICNKPELIAKDARGRIAKACYTVSKEDRKEICEWINTVIFPDGYVSNLSRRVDMAKYKMYGLKSHDCHVFMQRLIPIAFRETLPSHVWSAITEFSLFFKKLSTTSISSRDMRRLENEIPVIMCKLERIFLPSMFDSMEHLPIHLPYEARIAGPVQYRWMYPFERYLRRLKNNVRNKARVEGSIRNAYLIEEAAFFCSDYFDMNVTTKQRREPRNYDGGEKVHIEGNLSIFTYPGRHQGRVQTRYLNVKEIHAAHTYILFNCPEVDKFISTFTDELQISQPEISQVEIGKCLDEDFFGWFRNYERNHDLGNKFLQDLAKGPLRMVRSFSTYCCNGYKFQTLNSESKSATINSGVCIKGSYYSSSDDFDYYGRLVDIIELEYEALPIKRTVLFECDWFDPTPKTGTFVKAPYNLVEVNSRTRIKKYDPFIFAYQAAQVSYLSYPGAGRLRAHWLAVCKIKGRSTIDASDIDQPDVSSNQPLQDEGDDQEIMSQFVTEPVDRIGPLNDSNSEMILIDNPNHETTDGDYATSDYDTDEENREVEGFSGSDTE